MPDAQVAPDASRYASLKYRLALAEMLGGMALLWAYHDAGCSAAVAERVREWSDAPFLQVAAYLLIFGVVTTIALFPLRWYGSWSLEHEFGLSRLRPVGWLIREGKHLLVSGLFGLLVVEAWYALLRVVPTAWPLMATLGWVGFSVILTRIFPTWLIRIFYRTEPLTNEAVSRNLMELCRRVGLPALGVFRLHLGVETRKANAALTGLGRTRRVLVSDTLLNEFTPEEIETVLAHELGHHVHRHLVILLAVSGIGSWVAFTLIDLWVRFHAVPADLMRGIDDLSGFPLLMLALSFAGLAGLPIQQAISRACEWQADRFAVRLSGKPAVFASALRRLAHLNLADPNPPQWVVWLLYDHPPITQRIAAAELAVPVSP